MAKNGALHNWNYDSMTGQELETSQRVVVQNFDTEKGNVVYEVQEFHKFGGATDLKWQEVTVDEENGQGNVNFWSKVQALFR